MKLVHFLVAVLVLLLVPAVARTQAPPEDASVRPPPLERAADGTPLWQFEQVIVSGRVPGPGIWQVRKGGHVLHVVGALTPLPSGLQWETDELRQVLQGSQQYLQFPYLQVDAGIGRLRALTMLPSLLNARRNPEGKTLRELVPAEDYARWQVLKARYIGRDSGIERWRPMFASAELYSRAIRRSGMSNRNVVTATLGNLAKELGVEAVETRWVVRIENPRQVLREFSASTMDDRACFSRTLRRIEQDLGHMVDRANAWAVGDIDMLRQLPANSQAEACMDAVSQTALAERIGISDMQGQIRRRWLQAAEAALARNVSTVAVLPVDMLLARDGVLQQFRSRGYEVIEPVPR